MTLSIYWRFCHTLVLGLAPLLAQDTGTRVAVPGRVVDRNTGGPIVGAHVTMTPLTSSPVAPPSNAASQATPYKAVIEPRSTLTDSNGSFHLELEGPVTFTLTVEATGYANPFLGSEPQNRYDANPGKPLDPLLVRLVPAGSISGRIIDHDTSEPVKGLLILAYTYRSAGAGRALIPVGRSTTREDGSFVVNNLSAADYYLEVRPSLGSNIAEVAPDPDFLTTIYTGYPSLWYPGVPRIEEAVALKLSDGAPIQNANMEVRREPVASVRGRVQGGETESLKGAELALFRLENTLTGRSQTVIARGSITMGAEFQINGVSAGRYLLAASGKMGTESGPNTSSADYTSIAQLDVGTKNQQGLVLMMSKSFPLSGRVQIEGKELSRELSAFPEQARLIFRPLQRVLPGSQVLIAPLNHTTGGFDLDGVIPEKYHIRAAGLGAGYKIAAIRSGAREYQHAVIPIDGPFPGGLQITLDLATSALQVSVSDGTRLAEAATVVLALEPISDDVVLFAGLDLVSESTDSYGKATFTNLLPGHYRLLAFPRGILWADDDRLKERLMGGKAINITQATTAFAEITVQSR